jgi:hypothetical protein
MKLDILTAVQGYSGLGGTVAALGLGTEDPIDVDLVVFAPRFRCVA